MNNKEVILAFLNGKNAHTPTREIQNGCYVYRGQTLHTNNNILVNYSTNIAKIENNKLYINIKKYSRTTSNIQSMLRSLANNFDYEIILVEEEV